MVDHSKLMVYLLMGLIEIDEQVYTFDEVMMIFLVDSRSGQVNMLSHWYANLWM